MRTQLKEGEKLIHISRKHWFVLTGPFLFFSVCTLIMILVPREGAFSSFKAIILLLTMGSCIYMIYAVLERKYNIWAVTTERVIDEWGVLAKNVRETPIEKINNITVKQSIVGRIFGFGDIEIESAAEEGKTTISFISDPDGFHRSVMNAREEASFSVQAGSPDDYMDCPFCAEPIRKKARICRFCGREIK